MGYGYVLNDPSSVCVTSFIGQFRDRLIDKFQQNWYGILNNSPVLDMYRVFKSTLVYEPYLDMLPSSVRVHLKKDLQIIQITIGGYHLQMF